MISHSGLHLLELRGLERPAVALYSQATANNPVVTTALTIAMRRPLGDGLLRRLIDARGRAAPPEAAHACPLSDPCAESDAGHAWEAIGFITAAGRACRRVIVILHCRISRRST